MHRVEPWSYLRDLLVLLPRWPQQRILDLAPVNWRKTLEDQDTQQRLSADIYRRASIAPSAAVYPDAK